MDFREWKVYKLGEIYEFSSGLSKSRGEFGSGYEFLAFKDVFYNYFIPEKLTELVNSSEKERQRYSIKRGDVFLTRTSETQDELGMSSVALKDYENATFNGFTKRLRPKNNVEILPEYVGYYFRGPKFRNEVTSMSSMTTRASLNNDMMSTLKLVLPPLDKQKKIAKILYVLDKRIENSNQVNKNLQSLSQLLFKHWFIDFEFPNKDGLNYKCSGGEMVDSELGMIPKGWDIGCIGDYARVKSGYAFKSVWWENEGVPVIKIKDIENNTISFNGVSYVSSDKVEYAKDFIVKGGDLLIAMTGATIGKFAIVPHVKSDVLVNQRVGKFFLGDNPIKNVGFIYCTLKRKEIFNEIISRGDGSAQPNISPSGIESIKIVMPPKVLVSKFNDMISYTFEKMTRNVYENTKLSELRDILLPKLMNGEIDISNLEIDL